MHPDTPCVFHICLYRTLHCSSFARKSPYFHLVLYSTHLRGTKVSYNDEDRPFQIHHKPFWSAPGSTKNLRCHRVTRYYTNAKSRRDRSLSNRVPCASV